MKVAYKHILENLEAKPSIEDVSRCLYQLGHEHEIDNKIINIEITPNRGDCLSLNGILRDLSVFYERCSNSHPIFEGKIEELNIDFENFSKNSCPKISFLELQIEKVPDEYSGVLDDYFSELKANKINFFTDISNYISYEMGQPTHCYDAKKINNKIIFKEIKESKMFQTLHEKSIKLLDKNAVFIQNNEIINLAGVMGGKSTSCTKNTKSVIIECAFFNPESIIGKSIKYDLQSDAAYKFERGVDFNCQESVLRRFIKLVSDHTLIRSMSYKAFEYERKLENKLSLDVNIINKIIGSDISHSQYVKHLTKLGFVIDKQLISIPTFRNDITSQNDLAEEIARVIGYDNLPVKEINIPKKSLINNKFEKKVKGFLLDNGFYEVINSPFVEKYSKHSIKVDNPLDSNKTYLRNNLTDSLLSNLLFNERRQKDSIKLFEISDIYSSNDGIKKSRKLAIILSGRQGLNYKDFSSKLNEKYIKNTFNKFIPDEFLEIRNINRKDLNTKISYEIFALEIELKDFSKDVLEYDQISKPPQDFVTYQPISELPSSFKDLSYLLKNIESLEILQETILNFRCDIMKNVFIFDYYNNKDKNEIKIGFRFIFQSKDKTLTSIEIDAVLDDIISVTLDIDGVEIPGLS